MCLLKCSGYGPVNFRRISCELYRGHVGYSDGAAIYTGADKSLARPDGKKQFKGRHFSSDAEVIAAAKTWLEGQSSDFFLSGLQKLEFGHCSLFISWSG